MGFDSRAQQTYVLWLGGIGAAAAAVYVARRHWQLSDRPKARTPWLHP